MKNEKKLLYLSAVMLGIALILSTVFFFDNIKLFVFNEAKIICTDNDIKNYDLSKKNIVKVKAKNIISTNYAFNKKNEDGSDGGELLAAILNFTVSDKSLIALVSPETNDKFTNNEILLSSEKYAFGVLRPRSDKNDTVNESIDIIIKENGEKFKNILTEDEVNDMFYDVYLDETVYSSAIKDVKVKVFYYSLVIIDLIYVLGLIVFITSKIVNKIKVK